MYTITKEFTIDLAHRLLNYVWKCHNVHWHTYKILVEMQSTDLDHLEMVTDFNNLKVFKDWLNQFRDHSYIYWPWDEVWEFLKNKWYRVYECQFNPTAENMSKFLFDQFSQIDFSNWYNTIKISKITVYETPTSFATFSL